MSGAPGPSRPLRAGDRLPEFSGATASGRELSRRELDGKTAVVFFYPKAGSPGCSIESREFARLHPAFLEAGAVVVGVSVDPTDAQRKFREECELPFDLVADPDGVVSRRFGVLGVLRMARRTTFVIDPRGSIVDVIRTWRPRQHAERALERVRALAVEPGGVPSSEERPAP